MTKIDTNDSALLNAARGLQNELRATPYGTPKRLYIYCDLLYCYREIDHLLADCGSLSYDAAYIRGFIGPKNAHLN